MKSIMRLPRFILVGASLLATFPAFAQLNDGRPDPDFAIPESLDLPYALAFALDNNFTIRQAKERIRQQEGVVIEVSARRIPNVSASGSAQQVRLGALGITSDSQAWGISLAATQVLFAGGGVRSNIRSSQLAREAAMLDFRTVLNAALLDVRTRFYTVLLSREKIKVQEQNTELLQHQLQNVKNRYEAGTVSNFEVLRAEVALANAQTPLITARNDYRLAIEELRQALGFVTANEPNVAKIPEFVGTLDFKPASFELRSALATAREQRPDLQRLLKLTDSGEQAVVTARSGYFPTISAVATWQRNKSPNAFFKTGPVESWIVGVQGQWSLFDGRATAGRVAQARSLLEQAKLSLAEAQLSVDVDVRRAISTFQQATELAEASKKVVEQAEEAVRLVNARYSAGTATQLDVLTSQVDLTTARLNQLQAYYGYNIAVAATRKAMGLPDEMTPTTELKYPQP